MIRELNLGRYPKDKEGHRMAGGRIARLEKEPTWENIADSINEDTAGRNEELVAFIEMLQCIDGPYTVMLDAPWGEGKTFFVKSAQCIMNALNGSQLSEVDVHDSRIKKVIEALSEHERPTFLALYFNAWENDDAEDPISALFAALASQLGQDYLTKQPELEKWLLKVVDAAVGAISPLKSCATDIHDVLSGKDLIEAYRQRAKLREAIASMAENGSLEVADRLVIFIDELDRCRPDFAVRLLEQVKSLFQSENIITVFSADSVQLSKAMAGVYGGGYASQRFLERFFDYRVTLPPCDSFRVVTGREFKTSTMSRFDELEIELLKSRELTPRDVMRLLPKFDGARRYAKRCLGRDNYFYDLCLADMVATCAFLPVLIFIQRENSELFRSITLGTDFDSLYEEGRKYPAFVDAVRESIGALRRNSPGNPSGPTEEEIERYVHDLCLVIFSPDASGEKVKSTRQKLGIYENSFPAEVYKALSFPIAQDDDA